MTYFFWLGIDAEFYHDIDAWIAGGSPLGHARLLANMYPDNTKDIG